MKEEEKKLNEPGMLPMPRRKMSRPAAVYTAFDFSNAKKQ